MADAKLCPRRKKVIQTEEGYWNGEDFMECIKEKCAWLDKELERCAVLSIACNCLGWW